MSGFILIGIISMSVIQVCQIDVAYVLLYDLWSKSLKHTFIAPVHSFQLILGSWMIRHRSIPLRLSASFVASHFAFGFDFFRPGIGAADPLPPGPLFAYPSSLESPSVSWFSSLDIKRMWLPGPSATSWPCSAEFTTPFRSFPLLFPRSRGSFPLTYFLEYFRTFYGYQGESRIFWVGDLA